MKSIPACVLALALACLHAPGAAGDETNDYENPCGEGNYGGELGLGFRGASVGVTYCVEPTPEPLCNPAWGPGAYVGAIYGHCETTPLVEEEELCFFIEILGHKVEICV